MAIQAHYFLPPLPGPAWAVPSAALDSVCIFPFFTFFTARDPAQDGIDRFIQHCSMFFDPVSLQIGSPNKNLYKMPVPHIYWKSEGFIDLFWIVLNCCYRMLSPNFSDLLLILESIWREVDKCSDRGTDHPNTRFCTGFPQTGDFINTFTRKSVVDKDFS